jgi:hypothetical protein
MLNKIIEVYKRAICKVGHYQSEQPQEYRELLQSREPWKIHHPPKKTVQGTRVWVVHTVFFGLQITLWLCQNS